MADPKHNDDESEYPPPEALKDWLVQELKDSAKAFELRTKEARAFVAEYEEGKISGEEAFDRLSKYHDRWGEALYGATAGEGVTDQQIVEGIDKARSDDSRRLDDSTRGRSR
jgi:hypothetical protein